MALDFDRRAAYRERPMNTPLDSRPAQRPTATWAENDEDLPEGRPV